MDLFESKNIKRVVDMLVLFAQTVSEKLRFEPKYVEIKFAGRWISYLGDILDLDAAYNEVSVTSFADVLEKDEQVIFP